MCFKKNCWSSKIHVSHCLLQAVYPDYLGPYSNGSAHSWLLAPHTPVSFSPWNPVEFSKLTLLQPHILQNIRQAPGSLHRLSSLFGMLFSQILTCLPPSLPSHL